MNTQREKRTYFLRKKIYIIELSYQQKTAILNINTSVNDP